MGKQKKRSPRTNRSEPSIRRQKPASTYVPSSETPRYIREAEAKPEGFLSTEALIGLAALGFAGYFAAEGFWESSPHPVHWAGGLVGGLVGMLGGIGIARSRRR
jgi:hypothetical protein